MLDCGIGVQTESVSQHRALIFCQLKSMLDIVEKDLLKKHLPTVTYLRLDGSVPASMRQDIVHNFNTDPSIDVLLLTTQVSVAISSRVFKFIIISCVMIFIFFLFLGWWLRFKSYWCRYCNFCGTRMESHERLAGHGSSPSNWPEEGC